MIEISDAGHGARAEKPHEVNAAIGDFFAKH
jgi:hypothetical protein